MFPSFFSLFFFSALNQLQRFAAKREQTLSLLCKYSVQEDYTIHNTVTYILTFAVASSVMKNEG